MLSNYDFEILSMARGENGVEAKKVNDFCDTPAKDAALDSLIDRDLIASDGVAEASSRYHLTDIGRAALEAEEKQREQAAEKKRQDDRDRAERVKDRKKERRDKWLICLVSTCGGSILTLFVEHFGEILRAVSSWFS